MMRLSLSTMTASADMLGLEEEGEPSKFEKWLDKHFGKSIMAVASALGVVLGVALALLLFMYLPIKVVGLVEAFRGRHRLVAQSGRGRGQNADFRAVSARRESDSRH